MTLRFTHRALAGESPRTGLCHATMQMDPSDSASLLRWLFYGASSCAPGEAKPARASLLGRFCSRAIRPRAGSLAAGMGRTAPSRMSQRSTRATSGPRFRTRNRRGAPSWPITSDADVRQSGRCGPHAQGSNTTRVRDAMETTLPAELASPARLQSARQWKPEQPGQLVRSLLQCTKMSTFRLRADISNGGFVVMGPSS